MIVNFCVNGFTVYLLIKFFDKQEFPKEAAGALLVDFREFRAGLDDEAIGHTHRGEVP